MARSRNIKPAFFENEDLAECSHPARLAFIGLWTLADREGRLEDRPKRIRAQLFPFESVDMEGLLGELDSRGFIERYEANGANVIWIPTFVKHENPHKNESPSSLPAFDAGNGSNGSGHVQSESGKDRSTPETARTAPADSLLLNPSSLTPDSPKKGAHRRRVIMAADVQLPDGWPDAPVIRNALDEWLGYKRKRRQAYLDANQVAKLLRGFERDHGPNANRLFPAAVEHSIAQNYQGCFPRKEQHGNSNGTSRGHNSGRGSSQGHSLDL